MLSDWAAHLRAETGLEVWGAARLVAAQKDRKRDALYVVLLSEAAADNPLIGGYRQERTLTIGVITAISNFRDARGDAGGDDLEVLRAQIFAALLDWMPPGGETAVRYRAGRLLDYSDGTLWWQDEFFHTDLLSAAAP